MWADWITLRVGRVLFTEVAGAFLIGFAVGGFLTPQLDTGSALGPPPGRFGFGRFAMFDPSRLPLMLGIVAAGIATLLRIDLGDVLSRSSGNSLSTFVGTEARVTAAIRAGSTGQITVRDASGRLVSAIAMADRDIAAGTVVRIVGTNALKLVVAPRVTAGIARESVRRDPAADKVQRAR